MTYGRCFQARLDLHRNSFKAPCALFILQVVVVRNSGYDATRVRNAGFVLARVSRSSKAMEQKTYRHLTDERNRN